MNIICAYIQKLRETMLDWYIVCLIKHTTICTAYLDSQYMSQTAEDHMSTLDRHPSDACSIGRASAQHKNAIYL